MIDRYTKTVLTVIAVCLAWICVRDVAVFGRLRHEGAAGDGVRLAAVVHRELAGAHVPLAELALAPQRRRARIASARIAVI